MLMAGGEMRRQARRGRGLLLAGCRLPTGLPRSGEAVCSRGSRADMRRSERSSPGGGAAAGGGGGGGGSAAAAGAGWEAARHCSWRAAAGAASRARSEVGLEGGVLRGGGRAWLLLMAGPKGVQGAHPKTLRATIDAGTSTGTLGGLLAAAACSVAPAWRRCTVLHT